MKCLYPDKPCPYRQWVCHDGRCWWNCGWSCPHNEPFGECELANKTWGCLFLCIYDALAPDSACPYKEELRRQLEKALYNMCCHPEYWHCIRDDDYEVCEELYCDKKCLGDEE